MKPARIKIGIALLPVFFILSIQYFGLSKENDRKATFRNTKDVLSVAEAKELALVSEDNGTIVNIRGMFLGDLLKSKAIVLLEDEEPTGLEDVLLYCTFSPDELSAFKLKPGAEITVSGKLNRKSGYIEVTDCKIICINEAVLLQDFTKTEE